MRSLRKSIIAVAAVATMGAAAIPAAQARDARPIIAGAVIGAVVGGLIANSAHSAPPAVYERHPHVVYDAPVYRPAPVIVRPAPRVVYSAGPVYVERHDRGWHRGWRKHDDRWHRDHDHDHRGWGHR